MMPSVPKQSIPKLLACLDIAYIGLLPEPLFRFGISPNKLMDYMMAGKPVVMAIDSGNDPVTDAGCGFTVSPGDPAAIVEAILKLIALSPSERNSMGLAGRTYILKNQTYRVLADRFLKEAFIDH
jgi:glycosyltransferase involved in cell wall biosynthesis